MLVVVAACRTKQPAPVVPPAAPATEAAPAEVEEVPAEPRVQVVRPGAPGRTTGPTEAEVHVVLDRSFAAIGACFASVQGHTAKPTYLLRFTVAPTGAMGSVGIDGFAEAQHCVFDVLATGPFPAWHGAAMSYSVLLGPDGRPAVPDGG